MTVRRRAYGTTIVDNVSLWCSKDRIDVERGATLIGWGENKVFALGDLLAALEIEPTGTDEDFVSAAARLDPATVERLAPA